MNLLLQANASTVMGFCEQKHTGMGVDGMDMLDKQSQKAYCRSNQSHTARGSKRTNVPILKEGIIPFLACL
jgi:hypothetical protein